MNRKQVIDSLPTFGKRTKETFVKSEKVQENGKKLPFSTIPKVSAKRKKANAIYAVERPKFLKERIHCQIKRPDCLGKASQVHHSFSGPDRDKYFLDKSTWFAVCQVCHDWIHQHEKAASSLGFLRNKL